MCTASRKEVVRPDGLQPINLLVDIDHQFENVAHTAWEAESPSVSFLVASSSRLIIGRHESRESFFAVKPPPSEHAIGLGGGCDLVQLFRTIAEGASARP